MIQAGQEERGRQMVDEEWRHLYQAYEDGDENPNRPFGLGVLSVVRGETEAGSTWFERAYQAGFRYNPAIIRLNPMLGSVREDERFVDLVERMEADRAEMRRRAFGRHGTRFRGSVSGR